MRGPKWIPLLVVALLIVACAGASAPAPFGPDGGDAQGGAAPTAAPLEPASGQRGTDTSGSGGAPRDGSKIIRSGSLALQVEDISTAVNAGRRSVEALGGYVSASREENRDDQPYAQITYRIPVDRWDEGIATLRSQAQKVIEEATDSQEVTDQLVDLAARVRNLRASEDALIAIAARAEKISDVLEVQSRLTEVRGEIERLEAQRAGLEDQVAFATLTVTYGLEVAAVTSAVKAFDPNNEVDRASAQLIEVVQGVATAGIWFAIVWLPILIVLLVLVFVVARVTRRMGLRVPRVNPSTGWNPPPTPPA